LLVTPAQAGVQFLSLSLQVNGSTGLNVENAQRHASDASAYARLWPTVTRRETRHTKEKSVDAKEKSSLSALLVVDAEGFFVDAEEFFHMEKSFVHHASNVGVDAANEMHHDKNLIVDANAAGVDAEGFMHDAYDRGVDAKEFFVDDFFLGVHEKSPGVEE